MISSSSFWHVRTAFATSLALVLACAGVAATHGHSKRSHLGPDDNPLNDCSEQPNVGVISIVLPDSTFTSQRSVWHRRGSIIGDPAIEDPRKDRHSDKNSENAGGKPYDIYLSDTKFPATGKALVRVLIPDTAGYAFYEHGNIHGITRADKSDNEICGINDVKKNRQNFSVARFAINLPMLTLLKRRNILPDYSIFNIVIKDPRGNIRHLDPKIHNEGYPLTGEGARN